MSLTAELGRPPSPQHRSSSPQAPTLQPNLTTSFLSPPPAEGSWGGVLLCLHNQESVLRVRLLWSVAIPTCLAVCHPSIIYLLSIYLSIIYQSIDLLSIIYYPSIYLSSINLSSIIYLSPINYLFIYHLSSITYLSIIYLPFIYLLSRYHLSISYWSVSLENPD